MQAELIVLCTFAAITEGIGLVQAVPYAQDELVLLVPSNHELAQRGSIEKCELYNLDFVSLNQGSSVQVAQEETLLQQGIKWHKLNTHMVGLCSSPHASLHAGQHISLRPAHEARMHDCFVPNEESLVCNSCLVSCLDFAAH